MASYVSLTEVSEYAAGIPDEMRQARLFPQLPPEGKAAFCFYPMSKRRTAEYNWYSLPFEERKELMMGHGKVGRTFAGRILQVITGSTGLDDFEWGVTLFGVHPDDLKECVYEMRFDDGSANYAEFGPFYTGMVGTLDDVLAAAAHDGVAGAAPRRAAPAGPGGGGLQRRYRLGSAGQGGPRHAGAGAGAVRHRHFAVVGRTPSRTTAGRWPPNGTCAGWVSPPTKWTTPTYVANGADRCARCKTALMTALGPLARTESAHVVLGRQRQRPGRSSPRPAAASEAGATFPLVQAGFTKDDIRHWSKELGLRTWDKPAAACLASRLPYGTPVTLGRLSEIDARRIGAPSPRLHPAPGAPPRQQPPDSSSSPRRWPRCWPAATRWWPPSDRPDSPSCPSTWKASSRAA